MNSVSLDLELEYDGEDFCAWMGDDCGGSGIEVYGKTAEELIENLTPYLHDYLYRVEHPEEFEDEDEDEDED